MESGEVKGNIDAEMILQAMIDYDRYDQALIVSGDGDFTCLLRYLEQNNKLLGVLAPYEKGLSSLIQKVAAGKIEYLRALRKKIEYRPSKGGRIHTKPMPPMKPSIEVPEVQKAPIKQNKIPVAPKGRSPKIPPNPVGRFNEKKKQEVRSKTPDNLQQKKSNPMKGTLYTGTVE